VLENGDEEHGTSVHFVTDELDGGPVILQAKVPVFDGDSEEDVTERVQTQEHAIYPLVVSWFVDGRLEMRDGAAWLDGVKLPRRAMRPKSSLLCRVALRLPDLALPDIPSPTF
jgi:phosphoribosylglycinamide formyltransferase-1